MWVAVVSVNMIMERTVALQSSDQESSAYLETDAATGATGQLIDSQHLHPGHN